MQSYHQTTERMENFFKKINDSGVTKNYLTKSKIGLFESELVGYIKRHPATHNLKFRILFEDELPIHERVTTTSAIIVFSRIPDQALGHWSLIYICVDCKGVPTYYYIDPANPGTPTSPYVRRYFRSIPDSNSPRYLSYMLQHPTYMTCGYWVLHALTNLSLGMPFEQYERNYRSYLLRKKHLITQDLKMIAELEIPCYKGYGKRGPSKVLLLFRYGKCKPGKGVLCIHFRICLSVCLSVCVSPSDYIVHLLSYERNFLGQMIFGRQVGRQAGRQVDRQAGR